MPSNCTPRRCQSSSTRWWVSCIWYPSNKGCRSYWRRFEVARSDIGFASLFWSCCYSYPQESRDNLYDACLDVDNRAWCMKYTKSALLLSQIRTIQGSIPWFPRRFHKEIPPDPLTCGDRHLIMEFPSDKQANINSQQLIIFEIRSLRKFSISWLSEDQSGVREELS